MAAADRSDLLGTGRHLSDVELFLWTRFLDTSRLMEERLNRHLIDDHEMTHGEYEILVRVDGAGNSMRISVLADQCVAPRPRITQTLNRVEERGWIRRERDAHDGRGYLVHLTASGQAALARASSGHADLIKEYLLDQISADDQPRLAEALMRAAEHLRADRTG